MKFRMGTRCASALAVAIAVLGTASPASAAVPGNTALPVVSGTAKDGVTLSSSNGAWSGSPTSFTRQWRRCNAAGAACANIAGAIASTYLATSTDIGNTVRVVVTARNASGSSSATSNATGVVIAAAPAQSAAPAITGTTTDGQTLTVSNGTWSGTQPITYSRQWRRCDAAGANCADISGATAATYLLTSSDVGKKLKAVVTATNSGGSMAATSAATATVAALAPAPVAAPTVTGTTSEGELLTASTGAWIVVTTPDRPGFVQ